MLLECAVRFTCISCMTLHFGREVIMVIARLKIWDMLLTFSLRWFPIVKVLLDSKHDIRFCVLDSLNFS